MDFPYSLDFKECFCSLFVFFFKLIKGLDMTRIKHPKFEYETEVKVVHCLKVKIKMG